MSEKTTRIPDAGGRGAGRTCVCGTEVQQKFYTESSGEKVGGVAHW